jgi:hypothetical protein
MRKQLFLFTAATLIAIPGLALAEGKTPGEAISQHADKNGAFRDEGSYVTNGNVNFDEGGAKRSFHGQGGFHASDRSAVDTTDDDPNNPFSGQGTRVEPPGTMKK